MIIKNCTTNAQIILRDAEKFAYIQDYNWVTWDDIILSTFSNAEKYNHSEAFFTILGIKNRSKLFAYIDYINWKIEDTNFKELGIWWGKINFEKNFEKKLNNQKIWKWKKRDILEILEVWFYNISPELEQLF